MFLWQVAAVLALLPMSFLVEAAGQASFGIEPAGPPRTEVPQELRNRLEASGTRLFRTVNGIDIPVAELWWVKSLTVHSSGKTRARAEYAELTPGKLLAVLYLPAELEDVKNQKIPPGFYTLRYAQRNREKDAHDKEEEEEDQEAREDEHKHSGGEYRDYVLLARLQPDKPTRTYLKLTEMLELSRQVSPGKKPVMLALPPLNPAYKAFPYAVLDDQGNCAIQFKLPVQFASGKRSEMRIAILLVNPPNVSEED
ncbi:MAG: hypothetical protein ABSE44_00750 [Candidatus Sulfotelmatobacter sp.]|jgi:hypothetical protein